MRKVFLEQNLGKKSKCRFQKRNAKEVVIKLMIEAQKAVSTPSLTQPLVISGVPVIDFCDRFNQETVNYENGLSVKSRVIVNQVSKTFDLVILNPSIYFLMKRVMINQSSYKSLIIIKLINNLAMIQTISEIGYKYFLSDFIGFIKQIAGSIRSYDIRFGRNKKKIRKWQHTIS